MIIEGPVFYEDLQTLADRIISESDLIDLDTEFSSLDYWTDPDWHLKSVQFCTGKVTYFFDVSVPEQEAAARKILEEAVQFVSHNDADCISVKLHFGIDITDRNWDTLVMATLIWPERGVDRDLKTLVGKYVGPELQAAQDRLYARFRELLDKPEKVNAKGQIIKLTEKQIAEGFRLIDVRDPAFINYAAADAHYGRKLFYFLEAEMYKKGVHTAWPMECDIRAMATRMRLRGMQTAPSTLDTLLEAWGGRLSSARQQWEETYGCVAGSPKRADVLIESGVKLTKRTAPSEKFPEGQWSLKGTILEELQADYPDNEPLQLLLTVAENYNVATFLTTLKGFLDPDGIVHSSINTLGTVTGRWSVTMPAVQTVSGNNPCRSVIVPRKGRFKVVHPDLSPQWVEERHALVSADLGQIEPRVAVGLAEERNLIPDLVNGSDVYSAAAAAIFGPNYTPQQRKKIKRVILGTLYAAGEATLVIQARYLDGWTDVTRPAIREVRNAWKKAAPAIEAFTKYLQGLPIVKLESGRFVPQEGRPDYTAINSACQGTARDLLMERAVIIDRKFPDYLVMTMHDELLLDVPVTELGTVVSYVRSVMEMGYNGIPTPTDIEIFPQAWSGAGVSYEEFLKEYNG